MVQSQQYYVGAGSLGLGCGGGVGESHLEGDDLGPALVRSVSDPGRLIQIGGHHSVPHGEVEGHAQCGVAHLHQVEQPWST